MQQKLKNGGTSYIYSFTYKELRDQAERRTIERTGVDRRLNKAVSEAIDTAINCCITREPRMEIDLVSLDTEAAVDMVEERYGIHSVALTLADYLLDARIEKGRTPTDLTGWALHIGSTCRDGMQFATKEELLIPFIREVKRRHETAMQREAVVGRELKEACADLSRTKGDQMTLATAYEKLPQLINIHGKRSVEIVAVHDGDLLPQHSQLAAISSNESAAVNRVMSKAAAKQTVQHLGD